MRQAISPSANKSYGLARVCRACEIPRSTVYARRKAASTGTPTKPGPKSRWSDEELLEMAREILDASPWVGEGHRKVWARLRIRGVRVGRGRVLRIMRQAGLLAPQRQGRVRGPQVHDGSIIPQRPDVLWGTDMTTTLTLRQGQASIFAIIDHATAECLGIHAAKPGTRYEALEPLRQAVPERFGSYERQVAVGLAVRHDHGSVYISDVFQEELTLLGIQSSPAFVRQPEGNGCCERFFRTLKEQLLWIQSFETGEQLRLAAPGVQGPIQPRIDHRAPRLPEPR